MSACDTAHGLTVVLLTYNCRNRVGRVLSRIREMGVPIVAVDNASSDGTVELLRAQNGPGLEVVALEQNIGAAARNVGVSRAVTPYVAFCDDDG